MIQLVEAGHSYKVHGVKGEIIVDFQPAFQKHIMKSGVVFFKIDGNAVPFFIESIRGEETQYIKFKEVDNPQQARDISNKTIYIDGQRLPTTFRGTTIRITPTVVHTLIDYQLTDHTSGFSGIITGIEEYPSQLMAEVEFNTKKLLIPLHDDWIVDLNSKQKIIEVKLPEGIWDLNV